MQLCFNQSFSSHDRCTFPASHQIPALYPSYDIHPPHISRQATNRDPLLQQYLTIFIDLTEPVSATHCHSVVWRFFTHACASEVAERCMSIVKLTICIDENHCNPLEKCCTYALIRAPTIKPTITPTINAHTHPFQMQSLSIAALYYLTHSHKHLRYTHTHMHTHAITHILTQPSILTHIPNSPLNKPHPFKHTQPLISKHLTPSSAVHHSAPSLRTSFLFRRFPAHTRHASLSYTTTYILLSLNH